MNIKTEPQESTPTDVRHDLMRALLSLDRHFSDLGRERNAHERSLRKRLSLLEQEISELENAQ